MTLNVKPFRVLKRARWVKENDRAALELAKRNARARNKVPSTKLEVALFGRFQRERDDGSAS